MFKESSVISNGFKKVRSAESIKTMTIEGTVVKTFLSLFILTFAAIATYVTFRANEASYGILSFITIAAGIVGIVTSFVPRISPFTAPLYSALEGVFLGYLSLVFNMYYPGIAFQAILITIGIAFAMLFLYRTFPKFSNAITKYVVVATFGVAIVYLLTFVLSLFGISIPYIHGSGTIGIIFTLVVLIIAALNLIVDFQFIERQSFYGAPKYMEWYGAFGITVTLVWIYIKVLELLAKLQDE